VVAAPAGASAVVRIGDGTTSRYEVAPGELVTVPVEVVDAQNLGAATVLLSYDPAVVHAVGCAGPQSGDFDGGACNTEHDLEVLRFNVVALNGVDGTHRLYDITFQAVGGDGATVTDLTLTAEGSEIRELETRDSRSPISNLQSPISNLSSTWVNFYGIATLPVGTVVQAIDLDGVVCGAAVVHTEGQYGLLAGTGMIRPPPRMRAPGPGIRSSWWWMVRR